MNNFLNDEAFVENTSRPRTTREQENDDVAES
jgi:hypothetical protein